MEYLLLPFLITSHYHVSYLIHHPTPSPYATFAGILSYLGYSTKPLIMKAVVYKSPYNFKVQEVPEPEIQSPTDVIVKVHYSGICGTDLHTYRGDITAVDEDQILGHEFTGVIESMGEKVKGFSIGDSVVSTFTIQCGECWYCKHGYSGQCDITNTFGKRGLPGGQAEYVRVPFADNTLIRIDNDDPSYVMMADIFTTGYYGAKKILNHIKISGMALNEVKVLQLGLGPVGLCGLRVLKYFGLTNIVCLDNVPQRLQEARDLGFEAMNFQTQIDQLSPEFDCVLEVVGSSSALETAFKYVRRNGFISSIGMAHGPLPFNGLDCYMKNINLSFGRCHAWSLFPEALQVFNKLKPQMQKFIDHTISIGDAEQAYELFDQHKVNKAVIKFI